MRLGLWWLVSARACEVMSKAPATRLGYIMSAPGYQRFDPLEGGASTISSVADQGPGRYMGLIAIDGRFAVAERRGIGKGSLELLRALLKLDSPFEYEILVDRFPEPGLLPNRPNWRWRCLRPSLYPAWEQVRLPLYVAQTRPAIVHSLGNTAPILGANRWNSRLILTVHDLIYRERWALSSLRQRVGRFYRRLVVPLALRQADWLIVDSNRTRDQLATLYPEVGERISVIGIPVADHFYNLDPGSGVPQVEPPYLVAFGASDPRKNMPRLIQAFREVRKRFPRLELALVGCQPSVLRDFRSVDGLRFLPYISEEALVRLYESARALVYPSLSEGFGLPVLEAMAVGLPVITSDRQPMKELTADAAILIDPESVGAIVAAIGIVLSGEGVRSRLGPIGRRRAEDFRPQKIAKRVLALYELLSRPDSVPEHASA